MSEDTKDFIKIILFFVLGIGGLLFVTAAGTNYFNYKQESAAIEQLREDSAGIDANSEDVVGQITQANQNIKKQQALNDIPVICLTIPNGWEEIEKIPMPDSTKR